jgi:hypothetical protein
MKHLCTAVAPVMMALILSASGRPFNDPRSEKSDAIDQAAANEPRDQACYVRLCRWRRGASAVSVGRNRPVSRKMPPRSLSSPNFFPREFPLANRDRFECRQRPVRVPMPGACTLARCFLGRAKRKKQQHTI